MEADILVLTPTLGNRESIKKTIYSVKLIGRERVKHIIIAPKKEVEKLQTLFPEIEILAEPENAKGIYTALNYGFNKYGRAYKYLTFINDDDYWLHGFRKLFEVMDNNPTIDVVYGRTNYVDESDRIIGEQTSSPRYKAFKALLSQNIVLFTQQATLMKSDLFLKIGGFDEQFKLIADTNFWLKGIESNARFHYTNTICAAYTIQEGQLSSDGSLQKLEHQKLNLNINSFYAILEKYLFRLTNLNIYLKRSYKHKGFKRMNKFFHSS